MERSEAVSKLKQHEAELKRLGVEHVFLFGSTARGEAREDSDVDLFFDHPEGALGLFALMDVKEAATLLRARGQCYGGVDRPGDSRLQRTTFQVAGN
jgi:predicted nucleotidyltransferase